MLGCCSLQLVIAVVTTFARLEGPDGKPGSSLALGFLVPMFGFGLNGLWAAYHGDFPAPDASGRRAWQNEPPWLRRPPRPSASPRPPDRVWAIAADVERYPDWVRDVKDVVVRSRDEQQRPSEVEFRASALGRSTHYTLAYDYSQAPEVLAWKMVKGDIQRSIEGAYHLTPDGRRRHRGALRPGHRAGGAAARLRQAAGRGAHPQLGARAEDPRREP